MCLSSFKYITSAYAENHDFESNHFTISLEPYFSSKICICSSKMSATLFLLN